MYEGRAVFVRHRVVQCRLSGQPHTPSTRRRIAPTTLTRSTMRSRGRRSAERWSPSGQGAPRRGRRARSTRGTAAPRVAQRSPTKGGPPPLPASWRSEVLVRPSSPLNLRQEVPDRLADRDLHQDALGAGALARRDHRDVRSPGRDLRARPVQARGRHPVDRGSLYRRRLSVYLVDELRQPRGHRSPNVLRHLRGDRSELDHPLPHRASHRHIGRPGHLALSLPLGSRRSRHEGGRPP